ncbi:hypothetical protein MK131_10200 [Candidatus Poribacteria bacterium]|nr:hypothetical protein [Candidatus Poribacteria bacterium]
MILVDLNQIAISNLMVSLNTYNKNQEVNEDLIRHMVLNSLRAYKVKFEGKYGEMVICCDGRNYWRRELFPYYKAGRKQDRASSTLDWTLIFETLNKIRDEIKEYFPYVVIDVEGAEADDIIAVLVQNKSPFDATLILSGDKDFMQLQKHHNVDQYAPVQKRFVKTDDADAFLKEQILRGDRGDGIPNCLSPDDVFVRGARQKPISKKKLGLWMEQSPDEYSEDVLRGFKRNQSLIDLEFVPEHLREQILELYSQSESGDRSKLFSYFVKHKLKNLMENIQEF